MFCKLENGASDWDSRHLGGGLLRPIRKIFYYHHAPIPHSLRATSSFFLIYATQRP